MSKLLLSLVLLFIKIDNSYEITKDNIDTKDRKKEKIHPGISEIFFINYRETYFELPKPRMSNFQINIHSINCIIDIQPETAIIEHINFNIYSLEVNPDYQNISIIPLRDKVKGEYKENYEIKTCPLIINSYYINSDTQELKIENREENVFYLNSSLHISYDIKKISIKNFVSLNFNFKNSSFLIKISYIKNKKPINSTSKIITSSGYIFLNSDFFLNNDHNINDQGYLSISIQNMNNTPNFIFLKIIENNSSCLLEKNALNYGFLTSNTIYQYYYTEILKYEEGELMLHNKRQYGVLLAKIVKKSQIDIYNLNDTSKFLKDETELEYNQHSLQLKFDYNDTLNCTDGCYLLVTYKQIKSKEEAPPFGYEYTILSRTWNYTDYISDIIEIPYNEYIISCFGKGASKEHYYYIYIPGKAEKIIIQLEGNYFDFFYEEGRKVINTLNERAKNIEIKDIKNIFILEKNKDFKSNSKFMSFAFRPKEYNSEIISYYYFRVLYTEKNMLKYSPLDSNFGSLCIPEQNLLLDDEYYCYVILKNNYNGLNSKFVVSSSNQNEYFRINIQGYKNKDKIKFSDTKDFKFISEKNDNIDIEYYLFTFEFSNNETKNILISFCDDIEIIYPQIYSAQMYFLDNNFKTYYFKLNNDFKVNYQYISGKPKNIDKLLSPIVSKGKFSIFPISNEDNLTFATETNEYIYYLQLINDMKNKGMEELQHGKPLIHLTKEPLFPLFYYYEIKSRDYINININVKINVHNENVVDNYPVSVYILDEDTLERKKAGEYVLFPPSFKGNYSGAFEISFLEINKKLEIYEQYLLIGVKNNLKHIYLDSFVVEILVKENEQNDKLFLPKNEYIIETFTDKNNTFREVNQYYIPNPEENISQAVIELSSNYDDTNVTFWDNIIYQYSNKAGFQKFTINKTNSRTIEFNVTNPKKRKTNYMIRYYTISDTDNETSFIVDENFNIRYYNSSDNESNITISLEFNRIKLNRIISPEEQINFYITGTLYKVDNSLKELINTTCFLYERNQSFINKTSFIYNLTSQNNWTLVFDNIPRNNNYIYDLKIQVNAILSEFSKEEFSVFTTRVDLTGIKPDQINNKKSWLPWGIPLIIIVAGILLFFIIKFFRLKKKNDNLKLEIKTLVFNNDIRKNVLIEENKISKNEADYESTFI